MFDLEQAIADWRRQMLAAGIKTPVPLEELEIHLRQEIEQQLKSGMDKRVAYESAIQKIGQVHVVRDEFEKIDEPKDALRWKLTELTFGLFATVFPLCLCGTVLRFKHGCFADLSPSQQLSGVAALGVFALLAWSGRLGCKLLPVIRAKRSRDIITNLCGAVVMFWWTIFMNLIVPCHDFTMGQVGVASLWGFITPAGILLGLPWGMEAAARKKPAAS